MTASQASSFTVPSSNDFSAYEIFFDLPHPSASSNEIGHRIIQPVDSDHRQRNFLDTSELFEPDNISKITRFAFPEHDDRLHATTLPHNPSTHKDKGILNKHDIYFYSFQPHHFTFAIKLSNGPSMNGHVRRYFPAHVNSASRYDVGRRPPRAMVILTLAPGGERFYTSVLKTVEAISIHQSTTEVFDVKKEDRVKKFLRNLQKEYENLCKDYSYVRENFKEKSQNLKNQDDESISSFMIDRKNFSRITVEGVEHGENSSLLSIDKVRFVLPESLQPDYTGLFTAEDINCPMIPLMRALGASNVLRLLSALLCERRVIMVSRDPTRLSACMRGAASMLAQGLLTWQHLFVPILPPHLLKYVTVETPYLIGVLDNQVDSLDQIPGIGKLLCINLDTNSMTTFFVANPSLWIPDLLFRSKRNKGGGMSCPELLAQDLDDVLKSDKRMWAETKEKENQVDPDSKKKFRNLSSKNKSFKAFLRKRKSSLSSMSKTSEIPEDVLHDDGMNHLELNCCENEKAEEEVRVALTTFYLFIFGDMGMCLSESRTGGLWLDRKKYLRCKIVQGIVEDSNLFAVLAVFSRTFLFQGFVRNRIRDLELPDLERKSVTQKSLFSMCESFIRINEVDCSISNIRNVVQEHSLQCPQRDIANSCAAVRGKALSLTSNQTFEGDSLKSLASLIDSADEVNGSLGYVMGIVWIRIQETRSHLWKHPLLALYILRNLLLHGPISVITEANDGLALVRELRSYHHNKNSENVNEIRTASSELYEFLINRAYLFSERRQLACKRLKINGVKSEPRWVDYLLRRIPFVTDFKSMHYLVCPQGMSPSTSHQDSIDEETYDEESEVKNTPPGPMIVCDKSTLSVGSVVSKESIPSVIPNVTTKESLYANNPSIINVEPSVIKNDDPALSPKIVTPPEEFTCDNKNSSHTSSSSEIEQELSEINDKLIDKRYGHSTDPTSSYDLEHDIKEINRKLNDLNYDTSSDITDDKSDSANVTRDPKKDAEILKLVQMFNSTLDDDKNAG